MKKTLLTLFSLLVFLFSSSFSYAQCSIEQTEILCDIQNIDHDTDGTPDGIVNLYSLTGTTTSDGIWKASLNNAVVVNEATGELYSWELRNSSTAELKHTFKLFNNTCGSDPARILTIIIGPYSGIALPPDSNDINYYFCDNASVDLSTVLVSNETIPVAHINGSWSFSANNTTPGGFLNGNSFRAFVEYQPGLPRVDQNVYELVYTVPGISPCDVTSETVVKVAAVRQVYSGAAEHIEICESDILAGHYDNDIDVRDDQYLLGEDIEGYWEDELSGNGNNLIINIRDLYNTLTNNGSTPRFGCKTYSYTYTVEKRSVVCMDISSTVKFTIYEELRPFEQDVFPEFCPIKSTSPPVTVNLFDYIKFTDGFVYNHNTFTHWEYVSGPNNLGLIDKLQEDPANPVDLTCAPDPRIDLNLPLPHYDADAPVNLTGAESGTYRFKYIVCSDINCDGNVCPPLETEVVLVILNSDYAGEDTENIILCESQGQVSLRSLLKTNGVDTIVTTGSWTNQADVVVDNTFIFPVINAPTSYTFTYTTLSNDNCAENATLTFTIDKLSNAGIDGEARVCSDNLTITLFDYLGGDPDITGTWYGPRGFRSTDHLGIFDTNDNTLPILGAGEFIYIVPGSLGCANENRASVLVTIVEPIEMGNDRSETFCKIDGSVNLYSLLDRNTVRTGVFEDTDNTKALTTEGIVEFETLTNGIYDFRYIVPNALPCDESSLIVSVQIVDLPVPVVPKQEFCILDAIRLDDIVVDVSNFNWYDTLESQSPIIDNPLLYDDQVYFIANVDTDNCESERLAVPIVILNTGERSSTGELCTLDFQDGVSPNGDNLYDSFDLFIEEVYNLPVAFPDFDLKIYNRYGSLVFKGNRETEEFRGESNVSIRLGDDLPSGTYFYIFTPNFNNNLPIQGSFYLSR